MNLSRPTLDVPHRGLLTLATMLAVIMQILDTTIANVALPSMQGNLGAAQDTINWVLTSYIVASAIATPITGWVAEVIGRNRLFLVSVAGFTLASCMCGLATSLAEMVAFRFEAFLVFLDKGKEGFFLFVGFGQQVGHQHPAGR